MTDHGPAFDPACQTPLESAALLPEAPVAHEEDPRPGVLDIDLLLAQENWIRAVARNLVRDPARAEDVAQETLLAALQSPPSGAEDPRRLRAWLGRVAHNLAHLETRRRMRRRAREERVARGEAQRSAADVVVRGSVLDEVEAAVAQLEEPYQSAVRARYFEGKSTREIARASCTTDNAVRKRLWRARERLRQDLDRRHNGERLAWFRALAPLVGLPELTPDGAAIGAAGTGGAGSAATGVGWKAAAALPLFVSGALVAGFFQDRPSTVVEARTHDASDRLGERIPVASPLGAAVTATAAGAEPATTLHSVDDQDGARRSVDRDDPSAGGTTPETEPEEATSPPLFVGRVLHASDGRPVAGVRIGLDAHAPNPSDPGARVPGDGELVVATTDAEGAFALESLEGLPEGLVLEPARLRVLDADLATLRRGDAPAGADAEPAAVLFVVADAVALEGHVLDALGGPVAGARLELELGAEALLALDLALDDTLALQRATTTAADGWFQLASLPTGPGARLRVTPPEGVSLEVLTLDIPRSDRSNLVLALAPTPPPTRSLTGTVLLARAGPATDATVRLGRYVTRTDEQGRFELELGEVAPEDDLRANKPGWREATLDDFGAELVEARAVDRRDGIRLTLAERARGFYGTVVGLPAGPWAFAAEGQGELALLDQRDSRGRMRGNDGPSHDGGFAGNDEGGGYSSDGGGSYDPDGLQGNDGDPPKPPPAGNDGRALPPPLDGDAGDQDAGDRPGRGPAPDAAHRFGRPDWDPGVGGGRLRGYDPATGRVVVLGPLPPGAAPLEVRATPLEPRPRLEGRLVDRHGRPYDGARVRVSVLLAPDDGSGVPRRVETDDHVRTDADGRFVLERVPVRFADLRIDHPEAGTVFRALPDHDGSHAGPTPPLEIELARLVPFRVRAAAVPAARAFRLEDADGYALVLVGADADATRRRLIEGRSPVLRAPASARTLVLLDASGAELVRVAVTLDSSARSQKPTLLVP